MGWRVIRKTEESAFRAARAGNSMSLRLAKRHRVSPNASGAAGGRGVCWGEGVHVPICEIWSLSQHPGTRVTEHHGTSLYFEYSEPSSERTPAGPVNLSVPFSSSALTAPPSPPAMPSPARSKRLPTPAPPRPSLGRAWWRGSACECGPGVPGPREGPSRMGGRGSGFNEVPRSHFTRLFSSLSWTQYIF